MTYTVSWPVDADLKDTDDPREAVDYALERIGHGVVLVEDGRGNRFEVDFANGGGVRRLDARDPKEQLRQLKEQGLTFGLAIGVFAEDNDERAERLIEKARDEFRIESKRPRSREWEFSPDIFTTAASIEQARRNLDKIERSTTAPGWRYRIMARTVRTIRITTSWEEVT